jgi:anhydro-N-acetylmuramic acid kinase
MVVAGIMSGTSADGVDVALVRIAPGRDGPRVRLLGHHATPYPKAVRGAVLRAMDTQPLTTAELARLHWRLGELYADALERACDACGIELGAVKLAGLHGQTIYHQASAERYLGRPVRATWQIGEAAVIAERLKAPVVSDFRPADLAAGGQGAPLVPMLDFCLFRSPKHHRVLLNLGGIANLTALPAGASPGDVMAFDTGPANMVIDALMAACFGRPFDRGGTTAARGRIDEAAVAACLRDPWFLVPPPKSCGREQFGAAFVARLRAFSPGAQGSDLVATATELTAASILDAYARFVWAHLGQKAPLARRTEMIVAGGGVKNAVLLRRLTAGFQALGVKVLTAESAGLPAQAKEAVAFALLAWLRWHGMPGNLPSATGAAHPAILGKVSLW